MTDDELLDRVQQLCHSEAVGNLTLNLGYATVLLGKRGGMKLLRKHRKRMRHATFGPLTKHEVHTLKLYIRNVDRNVLRRRPVEVVDGR